MKSKNEIRSLSDQLTPDQAIIFCLDASIRCLKSTAVSDVVSHSYAAYYAAYAAYAAADPAYAAADDVNEVYTVYTDDADTESILILKHILNSGE